MGHFRTLLWKNWLIWRRTPLVSPLEILAPVILMAVLVLLRQKIGSEFVESTDIPEVKPLDDGDIGYMTISHYPFIDDPTLNLQQDVAKLEKNFAFAGVIPRTRLFFLPKSCFWTGNW